MDKREHDVEMLRKFMKLEWTSEQKAKLGEVFSLLDEIIRGCEGIEEYKALVEPRYTIERMVTAFMINRMLEEQNHE